MDIYRSHKTGRLVHIFVHSPRMVPGSWFEAEDLYTRKVEKHIDLKDFTLVGSR